MAEGAKWDAELYDEKHSFVWKMAAGLLELLAAKSGERILDVGCGTGHLAAKIATNGAQVTGVDQSPEMIREARAAYPALRFEVMDARQLEFNEQFDAVFSNATLHWIKEPHRAVESIARVIRPGGRFVAEFGGKGNIAGLVAAVERAWPKAGLPQPVPNPWYYPSLAEYASLLEKHGLEATYGLLFDRPTPLEDGDRGLLNWKCSAAQSWRTCRRTSEAGYRKKYSARPAAPFIGMAAGFWTTGGCKWWPEKREPRGSRAGSNANLIGEAACGVWKKATIRSVGLYRGKASC